MLKKRGLSDVVVLVLLLLLVLAGVVILWSFARAFIFDSSGQVETGVFTSSFSIPARNVFITTTNDVQFKVVRNAGEGRLKALTVVLEDVNKNRWTRRYDTELKELESIILPNDVLPFIIDNTEHGLGGIKKISIAPIILNKDGKEIQAGIAATYKVKGTEGTSVSEPGGNVGEDCDADNPCRIELICDANNKCVDPNSCTPAEEGNIKAGTICLVCTSGTYTPDSLKCTNPSLPICNSLGQCEAPGECTNECSIGTNRCFGSGYQTCVTNFDADSCSEWGAVTSCPNGCSGGNCILPTGTAWTQYMFNGEHTGRSPDNGPTTLTSPTAIVSNVGAIRSNIIIANNKMYFIGGKTLYAYDISTISATQIGSYTLEGYTDTSNDIYDDGLSTTPLIVGNDLYVNGDKKIYKFNINSISSGPDWERTPPAGGNIGNWGWGNALVPFRYPRQSPVADSSGKIYFARWDVIYRYDSSGNLDATIGAGSGFIQSTPLVTSSKIIFQDTDNDLLRYISLSDFTPYSVSVTQGYTASPILVSGNVFIGQSSGFLLSAFNTASPPVSAGVATESGLVYSTATSDGLKIFVYDRTSGKVFAYGTSLGSSQDVSSVLATNGLGTPVLSGNGMLYIGAYPKIYALSSSNLQNKQEYDFVNEAVEAPATVYGGRLFVPTTAGKIYVFS